MNKAKYIYRRVPHTTDIGPGYIRLRDGDEIKFGRGADGEMLNGGPHPLLCNLQLAVARVLKMSGAAELIDKWQKDVDDADSQIHLTMEDFSNVLDKRLLLSGRALIV
jgi:hypothetical protein